MASGQTQVSAETIEKTKQQIRGLVSEIAQLSKSDLGPEDYFRIESRKMSLWNMSQNSDRWKIFRQQAAARTNRATALYVSMKSCPT